MPVGKNPDEWEAAVWALGIAASLAGGLIGWWGRMRRMNPRVFNFAETIGELVTSGVVGVFTYVGLAGLDQPTGICAAAAGIAGHMGTRLLFLIERTIEDRVPTGARLNQEVAVEKQTRYPGKDQTK